MKKVIRVLVLACIIAPIFSCAEKSIVPEIPDKNEEQEQTTNGIQSQSKGPFTLNLQTVTATTATFNSVIDIEQMSDYQEVGFIYSTIDEMDIEASHITRIRISKETTSTTLTYLLRETQYYYTVYLQKNGVYSYGKTQSFTTPFDGNLSVEEPANCYIINHSGEYRFQTTKGNSNESVGQISSASVIWESFGTETVPSIGDLIKGCSYKDGYIYFETADIFKEGNALIAAKDADGNILWSWHIWLTDQPQDQIYYNDAGIVMDRNLGATSASIGDRGALGLYYQWGRKDPFLIKSPSDNNIHTSSTTTWYSKTVTEGSPIDFAISHPTTTINNWSPTNDSWTFLNTYKSTYDPCPVDYRIPDNIWQKATKEEKFDYSFNREMQGMNFSLKFGNDLIIWYPITQITPGYDSYYYGYYWFACVDNSYNSLKFGYWRDSSVYNRQVLLTTDSKDLKKSVRCIRDLRSI